MPFPLTSAEEVNQWVLNATNGHIPNFLSDIQSDVVLMLMNAMYFKGETVLLLCGVTSFLSYLSLCDGVMSRFKSGSQQSFDRCVQDQHHLR